MFTLAHISDLHFSSGAYVRATHKHSIDRLIGIQQLFEGRQFDRVLVTGDLTNNGDEESLLRVHSWLFSEFLVEPGKSVGLKLNPNTTIVLPGNHDAFNSPGGFLSPAHCWQCGIQNYNRLFPQHAFHYPHEAIKYDWLAKGSAAIFVVIADTCYLGDPELECQDHYEHSMKRIPSIARGQFTRTQSEQILQLFDKGIRGKLPDPHSGESIDRSVFARSLKIMVAHHYLFEARGRRVEPLLHISNKRAVFSNLASADFDLYVCGHKHVPDVVQTTYAQHLRRRERARFVLNYFRRILGLSGVPTQFRRSDGKKMPRMEALLLALVQRVVQARRQDITDDEDDDSSEFEQDLFATLRRAIDTPDTFKQDVLRLFRNYGLPPHEILSGDGSELTEVSRQIATTLDKADREQLRRVAAEMERFCKNLVSRPFIEVIGGSAAKEVTDPDKIRTVNFYEIKPTDDGYSLTVYHYVWHKGQRAFECRSEVSHTFHKSDAIASGVPRSGWA